jgi:preprotein translocase subunit SecA
MSDSSFSRTLAGPSFRRADTQRDERAAERAHAVETFLRGLRGWLPPGRESRRSIDAFNRAIMAEAQALRGEEDAAVVARYRSELQRLTAARPGWRAPHRGHGMAGLFACIGEASRRRLGMWPHPVQFTGARVLLGGCLAEMQTGEGKSLVAALAATAMAGSGAAVHIASTNDYLAQRDSEEMAPLFGFFGLNCAAVRGGMDADARRRAYRHSICYVSGKELVFDYLKDRLAGHGVLPARVTHVRRLSDNSAVLHEPLIPALHFAIVDEVDSVVIDEARTPMIISREAPGLYAPELLQWAIASAQGLRRNLHFRVGTGREIDLLPGALAQCTPLPDSVRGAWRSVPWRELLLRQALTAVHLFLRDQHYIVTEGKVQIVDESTGRTMADRSWEQGLHQLIETKEGLDITQGRETLARMTFQRFFRRYFLLAGLTGTAAEASRELWSVYRLKVRRIPPNRPNRRARLTPRCEPTLAAKWSAVADEAAAAAARGQPVLVGTRSVEASEQVAAEFTRRGVAHVVLNARQDAEEAQIVGQAGEAGRITVATNMAGRGTDIKLSSAARQAGGLHVVLTEFHESPRVDRQLFGRCARQGDAGSVRAIVSAQDASFAQLPAWLRSLLRWRFAWLRRAALRLAVHSTQARAERRAYKARMHTLRQDRELSRTIGFAGPQS